MFDSSQLLDCLPVSVVTIDGAGIVTRANAATETVFGFRPEELEIGRAHV